MTTEMVCTKCAETIAPTWDGFYEDAYGDLGNSEDGHLHSIR
jgi:hypothetical protein